ncbi:unnamed protein product [Rotaria sp. Silwood1]|nr:unnamed protein product [Rotaria sp. Silwood1]CAF1631652.1 unnamed protein product [Rotaria sp. Silwood1]CAF4044308.1 unnamed protein product [Rotaria sp. Silwood1]CAF4997112.1 unnamed protein product [Rotaria sp. Silwood1]CAF5042214.1 unnamed protein product [Rotaria sp. Silwood1]
MSMPGHAIGNVTSEIPPYDVLAGKDGYEIRRYQKQLWAQITYEVPLNTEFMSEMGTGFFPLHKYIFGNNISGTIIPMTAPVIIQEITDNQVIKRTMTFIMSPSRFSSLDQLPTAIDTNIRMVEEPNTRNVACITFNMTMTHEKNATKEQELREAAHRDGLILSSDRNDVMYFGYNPPFTIPYFRRNEICIPIVAQQ